MTKFKKVSLTGLAAITAIAAPVITVVSCGSNDDNTDKIIYIQAEKEWKPAYEKIINDFKKEQGDWMNKRGIQDIKIVEMNFTEAETSFANKGINDKTTPDVFLVVGDKLDWFKSNRYLKPFTTKTANEFLTKYTKQTAFEKSAQVTINSLEDNGQLWGVPENVEAMVKMFDGSHTNGDNLKVITRFSDLWMSAGFFNTNSFNLRDIVWTDINDMGKIKSPLLGNGHGTIKDEANAKSGIEAGFKNILTKIKSLQDLPSSNIDLDGFNTDSAKAAPKINDFLVANKDKTSLFAGPWDYNTIKKILGGSIGTSAITAKDGWNQWGGGFSYGMNARLSNDKRDVSEKLISYFYKDKYAKDLFNFAGKLTPIVSGRATLKKEIKSSLPEAIYNTTVKAKPMDPAFASVNVWKTYADIIGAEKATLAKGTFDVSSLSKKLANKFISSIKAGVDRQNKLNSN